MVIRDDGNEHEACVPRFDEKSGYGKGSNKDGSGEDGERRYGKSSRADVISSTNGEAPSSPRKQKQQRAQQQEDARKRNALVSILAERIVAKELRTSTGEVEAGEADKLIEVHALRLGGLSDPQLLQHAAAMSPSKGSPDGNDGTSNSTSRKSTSSKKHGESTAKQGSSGKHVRLAGFATPDTADTNATTAFAGTPIPLSDLNLELKSRHHTHTFEDEGTAFMQKMEFFYKEHEPGKTKHIETIVGSPRYTGKQEMLGALQKKYGKEVVQLSFSKFDEQREKKENEEKFEILQACMAIEKKQQQQQQEQRRRREQDAAEKELQQKQQEDWYGEMRREAEEEGVERRARLRRPSRSFKKARSKISFDSVAGSNDRSEFKAEVFLRKK
jgi:hypothetical protein